MIKIDNFGLAIGPELRLLACFVSLLANKRVLYHIFDENQEKLVLNLRDLRRSKERIMNLECRIEN